MMDIERERTSAETREAKTSRKPASASLATLNLQAKTRTFAVDDVDWSLVVDAAKPWMPESLVSASYLPSYGLLSKRERLRFNQLMAVAICEQFIWLEEDLLCPILRRVLARGVANPELRECLENFVAEEERHSLMFRKLILKADREASADQKYRIFNLAGPQKWFFNKVIGHPETFLVWIWMAIYFEEKTLHFSQEYKRAERAGQPLDALFARAHFLHSLDEARHLQIDQYLLREFYEPAPKWKRVIAGRLAKSVFEAYRSPRRTTRKIIEILRGEPGASIDVLNRLEKEIPTLAENSAFGAAMFGPKAAGRTRELLKLYPETAGAYEALVR